MSESDKTQDDISKTYATLRERELSMKFDEMFYRLEAVCKELEGHSHHLRVAYHYSAKAFRACLKEIKQEVDQIRYIRVE